MNSNLEKEEYNQDENSTNNKPAGEFQLYVNTLF